MNRECQIAPIKRAFLASRRLFCESVKKSFAALRVRIWKTSKFGAACIARARQWGWALSFRETHVVDREGRAGRRIAELRLVECFGKFCQFLEQSGRHMAEGRRLRPVQRRRRPPATAVSWTGACVDGYAEGLGTATFTHDGQSQSFTANFAHGVIPDGHVITRWGQGWSYDGETVGGRFNGARHPDHRRRRPLRRRVDRRQDERLRRAAPRQWRALCRRLEGRPAQWQGRTAPCRRHTGGGHLRGRQAGRRRRGRQAVLQPRPTATRPPTPPARRRAARRSAACPARP